MTDKCPECGYPRGLNIGMSTSWSCGTSRRLDKSKKGMHWIVAQGDLCRELTRLRAVAQLTVRAREMIYRNPDECYAALDEAVGMMEGQG